MNEFNADPLELGILGDMGLGDNINSNSMGSTISDTGSSSSQFAPSWN